MMHKTRRSLLLATASTVAVVCSGAVYGVAPTNFFHDLKGRKPISFNEAHSNVKNAVYSQLAYAEKFGIKHDDREKAEIEQRIWDHAQYLLSEHYYSKEAAMDVPSPDKRGGEIVPGVAKGPIKSEMAPARAQESGKPQFLDR